MVNSGPLYLAYILCVGFFILFCVFLCGFLFFVTKLPSIRELHLHTVLWLPFWNGFTYFLYCSLSFSDTHTQKTHPKKQIQGQ